MSYLNCLSSQPNQVSSLVFMSNLDNGQARLHGRSSNLVVNCKRKMSSNSENGFLRMSPQKNHHQVVGEVPICTNAVVGEVPMAVEKLGGRQDGIGIVNFLKGKNFFITGGTGFFGKVLVEKLLRSTPDIGKIYLMINARDKEVAAERLQKEIVESEIFKEIKQRMGGSYESFMSSKLIPVKGNVGESDLNLDKHDAQMVAKDVHFIISSAATTTFDERYDLSLKINSKGPCHLMALAKKCNKLELFMQISTAYANGERKGRVMEKLFTMGDTIALENFTSGSTSSFPPLLDVENELSLTSETSSGDFIQQYMKNLGLERAKKYGWQDTYVFTKAMGEMVVNQLRGDIPVVILRPSIIESTYRDPFPGWIEGNRMMDPVITLYGKGLISGFMGPPNCPLDVVPADMVVNATVAALAKHGMAQKQDINVYQVASSVENPLDLHEMGLSFFEHFNSSPYIDTNGKPVHVTPWKHFDSKEEFVSSISEQLSNRGSKIGLTRIQERIIEQVDHLAQVYEPYTSGQIGRFDINNTIALFESMSQEEKATFGFDVKEINWRDYLVNVHIPGLRRNVMKGRGVGIYGGKT